MLENWEVTIYLIWLSWKTVLWSARSYYQVFSLELYLRGYTILCISSDTDNPPPILPEQISYILLVCVAFFAKISTSICNILQGIYCIGKELVVAAGDFQYSNNNATNGLKLWKGGKTISFAAVCWFFSFKQPLQMVVKSLILCFCFQEKCLFWTKIAKSRIDRKLKWPNES